MPRRSGRRWLAGAGWLWGLIVSAIAVDVWEAGRTLGLGDLQGIAASSDGRRFATAGQRGAFLWDRESGEVRHVFEAHGGKVTALAFSPDGTVLLSAGADRRILAWDTATGASVGEYAGHRGEIREVSFGTDGDTFVSASADNTARVWSLGRGGVAAEVRVPGVFIEAARLTSDGGRLVTVDGWATNNVRVWELDGGAMVGQFGEPDAQVRKLAWLDDRRMVTASDMGRVRLWALESGDVLKSYEGATGLVTGLEVFPERGWVVAGMHDGGLYVWDAETGGLLMERRGEPGHGFAGLKDEGRLLTAGISNRVGEWDLAGGGVVRVFEGHTTSVTLGVAFSPDGQWVVSGGAEGSIRLWERSSARPVRTFEGHGAGTMTVAFSPDGRRLLSTRGAPRPTAQWWDTETGQVVGEFAWDVGWPTAAVLSGDGTRLATGAQDPRVRIWRVDTGALERTLVSRGAWIQSLAFSRGGELVAAGGSSFSPVVTVWDAATGMVRHEFTVEAGSVTALDFSPDGSALLVGWEDGYLRIVDMGTGRIRREYALATGFLNAAVFSPDGAFILTGEGWPMFSAQLIEVDSGRVLRRFRGHRWAVDSVAFDPAGAWVATGSDAVRLWRVDDVTTRLRTRVVHGGVEIAWEIGTLQEAASVEGPWSDVPGAVSPRVVPIEGSLRFHRVRLGGGG